MPAPSDKPRIVVHATDKRHSLVVRQDAAGDFEVTRVGPSPSVTTISREDADALSRWIWRRINRR